MDAAGISCFTTPSDAGFAAIRAKVETHLLHGGELSRLPHSNQLWMLAGFVLFKTLREIAECIEVYPQATARALGAAKLHKSQSCAAEQQLNAAAAITGWPNLNLEICINDIAFGPTHDKVDAYLCAWVASLEENERESFGEAPDDVIWVPKIPSTYTPLVNTALPIKTTPLVKAQKYVAASHESELSRTCPACGSHTFKRWPWGWDAHAAHKCAGLIEVEPEARKREFKRKFMGGG